MQTFPENLVLYSDESLLVVNKPAGISTLPDGYDPTLPHIKTLLEWQYGRLWIVHRLDKGTSGVLVLARSAEAHRSLNTQFEKHLVNKIYHACVYPSPAWQEKTVDLPLRANGDRQHRTVVDPQAGKPAVTHFSLLERFEQAALLAAKPETGRSHQIRAHLSAIGLCIFGDKLYARKSIQQIEHSVEDVDSSERMSPYSGIALHALSLEFNHPLTLEKLSFTAPYPAALIALLDYLRTADRA